MKPFIPITSKRPHAYEPSAAINSRKKLATCQWPPVKNCERLHQLSESWAAWWRLDIANFLRVSVAFFIIFSFVYSAFQRDGLEALYKIDRVLPLDQ